MLLCEHPDFEQAILRAADHFRDRGLRPAIIEDESAFSLRRLPVGATSARRGPAWRHPGPAGGSC